METPFPLPKPLKSSPGRGGSVRPVRVTFVDTDGHDGEWTEDTAGENSVGTVGLLLGEDFACLPPKIEEQNQMSLHHFMAAKPGTVSGGSREQSSKARLRQLAKDNKEVKDRDRSRSPVSSTSGEEKEAQRSPKSSASDVERMGFHAAQPPLTVT